MSLTPIIVVVEKAGTDPLDFFAQDNPCENCGSTNLTVEEHCTRHWRGLLVGCLDCGEVMEYDEPEQPAEHRSAEW